MDGRGLHLVLDLNLFPTHGQLLSAVSLAVEGGVDYIHLRAPHLGAGALFDFGVALRSTIGHRATLVVNDRVDVAVALQATCVQLGSRSLSIGVVRDGFPALRIGASVHSVTESIAAEQNGANWLLLGTIFATGSHPERIGEGPALIREVRRACRIPIVAIGGIHHARVPIVRDAGASGIAVISAILSSADPRDAAQVLRNALVAE